MRYSGQAALTQDARARPQLWRLVTGTLLAVVIGFGLSQAAFALARGLLPGDLYWMAVAEVQGGRSAGGLLALLTLTGALGVGTWVAARLLQGRGLRSLVGPAGRAARQCAAVFVAVAALNLVVALAPPWPLAGSLQPGMALGPWLALLPLTLCALAIQTGSEELLFRGYLQSQLAARLSHPVLWLGVPAALFGLAHHAPDLYGGNAWLVTLWAGLFGLAAGDLTARAGTLGPALALHMVNNLGAVGVVSLQGPMSGLALYHLPFGPGDEAALRALFPLDLALLGLGWLAARVALRV